MRNPKEEPGSKKISFSAIPVLPIIRLARVMMLGAKKYGKLNWRKTEPIEEDTYYDAILRHLLQWRAGEEKDPESGQSHLAHVMACCVILMDAKDCHNLSHSENASSVDGLIETFQELRNETSKPAQERTEA